MSDLLTAREAAAYLNVHVNTIKRFGDRGLIPFFRVGPRGDRRYRRADLDEALRPAGNER